jgi:hypothetical protein
MKSNSQAILFFALTLLSPYILAEASNASENRIIITSIINTTSKTKSIGAWYEKLHQTCKNVDGTFKPECKARVQQSLQWNSQIFLDNNTEVKIQCAGSAWKQGVRTIKAGIVRAVKINALCQAPPNSYIGDSDVRFFIGGLDKALPYIISPRYTLIQTNQPILQWNSVEGATNYSVSVLTDRSTKPVCTIQKIVADPMTSTMKIPFEYCRQSDSNKYQLEEGLFYRVVVTTSAMVSSEQESVDKSDYRSEYRGVEGIEFRLISTKIKDNINEAISTLNQNIEDNQEKQLSIAAVYASYNLYSEAISVLENSVEKPSTPSVYIQLGDYYALSGLLLRAEYSYCQAEKMLKSDRFENQVDHHKNLKERWDKLKHITSRNKQCND